MATLQLYRSSRCPIRHYYFPLLDQFGLQCLHDVERTVARYIWWLVSNSKLIKTICLPFMAFLILSINHSYPSIPSITSLVPRAFCISPATIPNTTAPSWQNILTILTLGSLCAPQLANAHGYITTPPSRQASCADGSVEESHCDGVKYEPQSVESPKGAPFDVEVGDKLCNGGGARFAALNTPSNETWPQTSIPLASDLNVEWKITAAHKTQSCAYYITKPKLQLDPSQRLTKDDFLAEPILLLDVNHDAPPATVSHTIPAADFAQHSGYAVIYGVWSIGDTGNAFYNCVDVNIMNDVAAEPPTETTSTSTIAAPTTFATSSGTAVSGTAIPGTAATTGSMSTATGTANLNVGYDAKSNSTVLTLSGRKVRRSFYA
jgi:predicted carbohydrate-binding protein with CBM5 and CBM33 domain